MEKDQNTIGDMVANFFEWVSVIVLGIVAGAVIGNLLARLTFWLGMESYIARIFSWLVW